MTRYFAWSTIIMLIIMLYLGNRMDHRKESVCVFANGRICNGPSDATYESDCLTEWKYSKSTQILHWVNWKKLLGKEYIFLQIKLLQYQTCNLEDYLDIKRIWQVIRRFSRQLTCVELYANICDVSCDENIEQLGWKWVRP